MNFGIGYAFLLVFILVGFVAVWLQSLKQSQLKRHEYIAGYIFPQKITDRVLEVYPHLDPHQIEEVISGLRDYFQLCNLSKTGMVSMPSQVVDVAWHEFILFTRDYQDFCQKAFGRFLHHTPAEAMKSPTNAQRGIKHAWKLACGLEESETKSKELKGGPGSGESSKRPDGTKRPNTKRPNANSPDAPDGSGGPKRSNPESSNGPMPRLFTLDSKLKIPKGFRYARNCSPSQSDIFCATDIGCSSNFVTYGLIGAAVLVFEESWLGLDNSDDGPDSDHGSSGYDGDIGGGCGGD